MVRALGYIAPERTNVGAPTVMLPRGPGGRRVPGDREVHLATRGPDASRFERKASLLGCQLGIRCLKRALLAPRTQGSLRTTQCPRQREATPDDHSG